MSVLLTILLLPWVASAQNPAITLLNGLSFGTVVTNTTSTIAPSDPGAAEFEVQLPSYNSNVNISLTFSLPANLKSGGKSVQATFGSNSAAWNTTNSLSGSTSFDPRSGYSSSLYSSSPVTIYVWIGGTISPPDGASADSYTGTISVNATATTSGSGKTGSNQASLDIPESATIIKGLSLMASGSLDFGLVVAGTTPPSLSPQSGSAPVITAAGSSGHQVTVTYSPATTLTDANGHTLTFTPSVCGADVSGDQAVAASVVSGSRVTLSGGSQGKGYYYLWLGGALAPVPTDQPSGNYSGTFTLAVSY